MNLLATPVKVSLATNDGPQGLLLLAIVDRAVQDINAFRDRRKAERKLTAESFNRLLLQARCADRWLSGRSNPRITLQMVAEWHGMDLDQFRDRIYQQWDDSFLALMRSLIPVSRGRGASTVVGPEQEVTVRP